MKKLFTTIILFLLLIYVGNAQEMVADPMVDNLESLSRGNFRSVSKVCHDTVQYPFGKRTSNRGIFLNDSSSATGLGQWYDVPQGQTITVTGFEFFSYQSDPVIGTPVNVECKLYRAGANFLPDGPPIATRVVTIPTSINTSLPVIRKLALFQNPVTLNYPYILSVENYSNISVTIYTNNWDTQDGEGEFIAVGLFQSVNWFRGSNITVGGTPFDADVYCHPLVTSNITTDFSMNTNCIEDGDTVRLNNLSTQSIFESKFYNIVAFNDSNNSGHLSYSWDYGDGTPVQNLWEQDYGYATKGKYVISLQNTLFGWKNTCAITKKDSVDQEPVADFTYAGFNPITFTNLSVGADNLHWDFGDGTFSHSDEPIYAFLNAGSYPVKLKISNACGSDSVTFNVEAAAVGIEDLFTGDEIKIYPIPANDEVIIELDPLDVTQEIKFSFLNIIGKEIHAFSMMPGNESRHVMDVSSWQPGIYFVVIESGKYQITKKIRIG